MEGKTRNVMDKETDFSKLSNAEINLKLRGYENEYEVRKNKVMEIVYELGTLDELYRKGKEELKKRGALSDDVN